MASWPVSVAGMQVTVDLTYLEFVISSITYSQAAVEAFAKAMGASSSQVTVNDVRSSASGYALIIFDISLFGTSSSSSDALVTTNAEFLSLFTGTNAGDPAVPALVSYFQEYGLPVAHAYYGNF